MEFAVSAVTDVGLTKDTNQDSYNARILRTPIGNVVFAVLCDGMGGLSKGEVASASLVRAFISWTNEKLPGLCKRDIQDADIRNDWTDIVVDYNGKIKNYGARFGLSMGTTVTAVLITQNRYFILNVGDTRCYELCGGISQLTRDQTVVAREVELGNLTPQEAKTDSRRSVLLQCVGASDAVYPDFFFGDTRENTVYMLCSDGFRHEITDEEIYSYLRPEAMPNEACMKNNLQELVTLNKQRMERDNITVLAVRTY